MKTALASLALTSLILTAFVAPVARALEPAKASDLVTLVTDGTDACPIDGLLFNTRILADGSQEPFTIPAKRVLVITGVDFVSHGGTAGAPIAAFVNQQPAGAVLESTLLTAVGIAGPNGFAAGTASAGPGIAARGGVPLCIDGATAAVLRGFLAKDK